MSALLLAIILSCAVKPAWAGASATSFTLGGTVAGQRVTYLVEESHEPSVRVLTVTHDDSKKRIALQLPSQEILKEQSDPITSDLALLVLGFRIGPLLKDSKESFELGQSIGGSDVQFTVRQHRVELPLDGAGTTNTGISVSIRVEGWKGLFGMTSFPTIYYSAEFGMLGMRWKDGSCFAVEPTLCGRLPSQPMESLDSKTPHSLSYQIGLGIGTPGQPCLLAGIHGGRIGLDVRTGSISDTYGFELGAIYKLIKGRVSDAAISIDYGQRLTGNRNTYVGLSGQLNWMGLLLGLGYAKGTWDERNYYGESFITYRFGYLYRM